MFIDRAKTIYSFEPNTISTASMTMDATTIVSRTGEVSIDASILKCMLSRPNTEVPTDHLTCIIGLPKGIVVTRVAPWAASGWTETRRLTTKLPKGDIKEYFVKSNSDPIANTMFKGEFASLDRLHSLVPSSCPKPHGWGEYETKPGTYFIVMDFLYLTSELPDELKICGLISNIHQTTAGTSLEGKKFGFDIPTCHGKIAQPNQWEDSWARFYAKLLDVFYREDIKSNGPYPEYERAHQILLERTIPRLLGALQAEGRVLTPCLVHGDFWQENLGINEDTGKPMLFDPSLFYGHNEFEIGMWRTLTVPFAESYRKQYFLRIPPSQPAEECDDRNRLYSLFYHTSLSAHWPGASEEVRARYVQTLYKPNWNKTRFHGSMKSNIIKLKAPRGHELFEQKICYLELAVFGSHLGIYTLG